MVGPVISRANGVSTLGLAESEAPAIGHEQPVNRPVLIDSTLGPKFLGFLVKPTFALELTFKHFQNVVMFFGKEGHLLDPSFALLMVYL